MEYRYSGKFTPPNLDGITQGVLNSMMTNKNILYSHWFSETGILSIHFEGLLKPSDRLILSDIVFENSFED